MVGRLGLRLFFLPEARLYRHIGYLSHRNRTTLLCIQKMVLTHKKPKLARVVQQMYVLPFKRQYEPWLQSHNFY